MNAAEQAKSIEMVSKIAAVVNLFKSQFPESQVDLSPWLKNSETEEFEDPNSIDLAFHFPRRNFICQSYCIFMQIRLPGTSELDRKIGVELSGYDYMGQQWQFTTTRNWKFYGLTPPLPDAEIKLRQVCIKILQLFNLLRSNSKVEE